MKKVILVLLSLRSLHALMLWRRIMKLRLHEVIDSLAHTTKQDEDHDAGEVGAAIIMLSDEELEQFARRLAYFNVLISRFGKEGSFGTKLASQTIGAVMAQQRGHAADVVIRTNIEFSPN